ncbi:MAG: hypothetical protein AAFR35_05490 [Pseudomonadota bacterium]
MDEDAQLWVVIPRIEVLEACVGVVALADEALGFLGHGGVVGDRALDGAEGAVGGAGRAEPLALRQTSLSEAEDEWLALKAKAELS